MLTVGRVVADRYKLLRRAADGGLGEVWIADDRALGRKVAIKCPRSTQLRDDPKLARLFEREAKAGAALFGHPNVVAIIDLTWTSDEGRRVPCVVMEWLSGVHARTFARTHLARRSEGLTRTALALHVVSSAARALAFAHERGVVHRDVKPANLMVTRTGEVKLADFGLAKHAMDPTRSVTAKGGGTLLYAAPEQLAGDPASKRTDAYQLGCTLFEMLEGRAPFEDAPNEAALVRAKLQDLEPDPRDLHGLSPAERRDVVRIYRRLVHPDAKSRATAADCSEALDKLLRRPGWRLHVKDEPLPPRAARAIVRVTGHGEAPKGRRAAAFRPKRIDYDDAERALADTTALLLANAGPYVYLRHGVSHGV